MQNLHAAGPAASAEIAQVQRDAPVYPPPIVDSADGREKPPKMQYKCTFYHRDTKNTAIIGSGGDHGESYLIECGLIAG